MAQKDEEKKDILQRIADSNRGRVAHRSKITPPDELEADARSLAAAELEAASGDGFAFAFEEALRTPGMSFICETKMASPSKGVIEPDYDPVAIARDYRDAGAAAISCLTEARWFRGSPKHLMEIVEAVDIPVLRKDFIVDEYQVFEAKVWGASAVLLIASLLDDEQLASCVALCHELGMSALVEAYEPEEVPRAVAAGARVVGVNNRDLRTFEVDFGRSIDLRPTVPPEILFVSESGVRTRDDVARLEEAGVDAVLIGETLMRAPDKRAALDELRGLV